MTYPPFKQQRLPSIILSQSSGRNKRSDHIRKRFCFNFCADFCLPYSTPSALNTASSIENFYFWISEALFRNFVGLYSNYSKHLHLSLEYAMMESRDRVLRLNHLSFRLYSLAALGFSRSGFFYVRNRNSPTLQRYRNFHSYRLPSPNPYGPFEIQLSRSASILLALLF